MAKTRTYTAEKLLFFCLKNSKGRKETSERTKSILFDLVSNLKEKRNEKKAA